MDGEYVRLCPSCGRENPPNSMRCACAAMLLGVDIVRRAIPSGEPVPAQVPEEASAAPREARRTCPFEDCGQLNPPEALRCAYCNRRLIPSSDSLAAPAQAPLLRLPGALAQDYRIVRSLPTAGAEADLLLVEPLRGGETLVAKIFREGVHPRHEVEERMSALHSRHLLQSRGSGRSDGRTYALMDYCSLGSLRDLFNRPGDKAQLIRAVVLELSGALAEIHAVQVVHRDLKPENVLVRRETPLELVLIDFGVASVLTATQRFTGTARTLSYAAPESLSGIIDAKADYWALGMILLEAALGRHPFAGLSEAVILHHLATRPVDVKGVADVALRKLIKGLLLRDPLTRWSQDEIARWLRNDPSLLEPAEPGFAARFTSAYRLADAVCETPEQLAVALAGHWSEGAQDLRNGQLLAWFRDVQKDQNTVRLLLESQHDPRIHVDERLTRLLVHLAPGLPPTWRGENVALPGLLQQASRALKGDEEAARWLASVYDYRVLTLYGAAGNADAAQLAQRWQDAVVRFEQAWESALLLLRDQGGARDPQRIVMYDDVVYGTTQPDHPSLLWEHPRLLALTYDAGWLAHLRQRMVTEAHELGVRAPWIHHLGDPATLEGPALLALEAVLPEAKRVVQTRAQAQIARHEELAQECQRMSVEIGEIIARVGEAASRRTLTPGFCANLRQELDRFFELLARILAAESGVAAVMETRKTFKRLEPTATRLMTRLDALSERREANSGWLDRRVLGFAALSGVILSGFFGTRALTLVLVVVLALAVWRIAPNVLAAQDIRKLAERFRGSGARVGQSGAPVSRT